MSLTVSIILDKKRESKQGYQIKIRITQNRVQNFISLKLYFSEDEFKHIKNGKVWMVNRSTTNRNSLRQNLKLTVS